ncbi:MAG: hypothetical protein HY332_17335 [Chloroflexi bacterium]|nr:hypothetical protein [Chloroflexota bacterium]
MAVRPRAKQGRSNAPANGVQTAAAEVHDRELAWISEHQEELFPAHAGEWIAVEGETLIATASDLPTLMRIARDRGHPHLFVTHIPLEPIQNLYV